jgi:hypothetical protein
MRKFYAVILFAFIGTSANAQCAWTQKTNFGGLGRRAAVGFSIGTKGYIGTGEYFSSGTWIPLKDFWEWDQSTNSWTQQADFGGIARRGAVGFSIGGKGYIGTGHYGSTLSQSCKDFWEWDQTTNLWTQKADFGGGIRPYPIGFSIASKGYIGTGYSNDFWEWDQTTNTWAQKANVSTLTRETAVAFSIGTKGYIGTGQGNAGVVYKDFWEWDQATDVWTQKADFGGTGRANAIGFSIGSKGFIGTGSAGTLQQDFWEWDQATNTWIKNEDFPGTARYWSVGFSIGGKGYIGTGLSSIVNNDFWEYDPTKDFGTTILKTDIKCNGANTGTATVVVTGNSNPYTYLWSNGQTNAVATGLSAANYTVTITNVNNCKATNTINIIQPAYLFADILITNTSTCNSSDGQATANISGGTNPYSYLWMPGGKTTQTITGLSIGSYTLSITDVNNCATTNTCTIQHPVITTTINTINSSSCSIGNGKATAVVSGGTSPFTYFWNPSGQTTSSVTGLSGGTYTVNITDKNGCTKTNTFTILSPVLTANMSSTNPSSCNANDGSATASVSNGTGQYIYSWSPTGQTTQTATGLPTGSYNVIVTDINSSCSVSATQIVSVAEWIQKANFGGSGRFCAVGFSIGTKGYIGTGNNGGISGTNYTDLWEWNQATNVWTQKASISGVSRRSAVGFSIGTKGYIGTGTDGVSLNYKDFWEWDQATNTWTRKADFAGTARYSAVGFSIGTKGYIGTGLASSNTGTQDFWEWDPATNVWTQKASLAGPARFAAVGFSIGTKGYIGTGCTAVFGSNLQDFWEWDQANNIWTQKANFGGTARSSAVGFSMGTMGYISTGYGSQLYYNDFWEWNQATNTWTQRANVGGTGRDAAVGFAVGTKAYIGMGYDNGDTYRKDFWEYVPCLTNPTLINEVVNENMVSVFPNPTNGVFQIQIDNDQLTSDNTYSLEIYNIYGERVFQSANHLSSKLTNQQIDISSQPNGIYFLKVQDENKAYIKKIVIQK